MRLRGPYKGLEYKYFDLETGRERTIKERVAIRIPRFERALWEFWEEESEAECPRRQKRFWKAHKLSLYIGPIWAEGPVRNY